MVITNIHILINMAAPVWGKCDGLAVFKMAFVMCAKVGQVVAWDQLSVKELTEEESCCLSQCNFYDCAVSVVFPVLLIVQSADGFRFVKRKHLV